MNNQERILEIEKRLREAFKPLTLTITDDSAKHVGHASAQTGMGHFSLKITSMAFQDKPLAERHRMIYTVLDDMMNKEIHALQIEAKPIAPKDLLSLVENTLAAHKALDIKILDVSSLTDVMDTMVICTATSVRHAASMADKLIVAAKKIGVKPFNSIENQTDTGWILIDLLDVVVHIMLAEIREFYSLEKLWTVTEASRNGQKSFL
ncbi:MAG TPA: ribosome silencing factor [Nitrosomonas sp.]|nr:ribosome silencing factor [Nitrosomonas sp.]